MAIHGKGRVVLAGREGVAGGAASTRGGGSEANRARCAACSHGPKAACPALPPPHHTHPPGAPSPRPPPNIIQHHHRPVSPPCLCRRVLDPQGRLFHSVIAKDHSSSAVAKVGGALHHCMAPDANGLHHCVELDVKITAGSHPLVVPRTHSPAAPSSQRVCVCPTVACARLGRPAGCAVHAAKPLLLLEWCGVLLGSCP